MIVPFICMCDPFDEEYGERYFGVYGVEDEETIEHIADRDSFADARELELKLAPGADCPERVAGLGDTNRLYHRGTEDTEEELER